MDGNNKDGEMGINTVLNALKDGFDFVQGTRFVKGGISINTPFSRYIAIRMIHAPLISLGSKKWFTDTTNGFRGHSKKLIESKEIGIFRDVFDTYELLTYLPIAAQKYGYKTTEVGVLRQYPKNLEIPTKINGFKAKVNLMVILMRSLFGCYNK
jgi:dolichol-phosphate mannosyltransferase